MDHDMVGYSIERHDMTFNESAFGVLGVCRRQWKMGRYLYSSSFFFHAVFLHLVGVYSIVCEGALAGVCGMKIVCITFLGYI